MSMHDPISDMLARIYNAQYTNRVVVAILSPKLKCTIAEILKEEDCVEGFSASAGAKPVPEVQLKYYAGHPVIEQVKHVSRPGLCIYEASSEIPNVINGLGIAIVNTSKGVMTNRKAHPEDVGGELLYIVA